MAVSRCIELFMLDLSVNKLVLDKALKCHGPALTYMYSLNGLSPSNIKYFKMGKLNNESTTYSLLFVTDNLKGKCVAFVSKGNTDLPFVSVQRRAVPYVHSINHLDRFSSRS